MKNLIYKQQWGWKTSGIALGLAFLLAVMLVKPIGVSTQFVILDGMVWDFFNPQIVTMSESAEGKAVYSSSNAYLDKSKGKYAKSISNPLNYGFIFVFAMAFGGFLASKLQNETDKTNKQSLTTPTVWVNRFGNAPFPRHITTFIGGFLVLFGARLAGGCTSGHMMSGMMQTSLSGYLFSLGAFAIAIPTAILIYKRGN